ncbi:hypothetical protein L9F63_013223, partial [Diploptera punctata]
SVPTGIKIFRESWVVSMLHQWMDREEWRLVSYFTIIFVLFFRMSSLGPIILSKN